MKSRFVSLVLIAGLSVACRSGGENPPAAEKSPAAPTKTVPEAKPAGTPANARADRLAALGKEWNEAQNAYYEAIQAAMGDNKNPSAEDWKRIQEKAQEKVKEPDTAGYLARAQQLLDEDKTDLTAFETIQWMLNFGREPEAQKPLMALLGQYHMDRPEMGDMCNELAQYDRALLEKLSTKSPHFEVRGRACYALAEGLKKDIQTAEHLKGKSQEELDGMKGWLGDEKLAALQKLDADATQKESENIYERVVAEFGEVKVNVGSKRETTLGKQAGAALYEIRNLAVGKSAPEIEGADLDSVAFKLSDYRGKVVLLDFWGNW
jgi:hypothetical protein